MRKLPADIHPDSLSRVPLLEREELDEHGKKYYDAVTGPGSRTLVGLQGPVNQVGFTWPSRFPIEDFLGRVDGFVVRMDTAIALRREPGR